MELRCCLSVSAEKESLEVLFRQLLLRLTAHVGLSFAVLELLMFEFLPTRSLSKADPKLSQHSSNSSYKLASALGCSSSIHTCTVK